jgi:ribosomal protein S18 acetylase RimI-like enzyme
MSPVAPAPGVAPGPFRVREVRYRELDAYFRLALSNAGPFDRQVGLLDRAEEQFRAVRHPVVWTLLSFLRRIGRSPFRLLTADEQGTLVGSTAVVLLGPWAYVAAVGVREDRRRRGIAEALVTHAEELGGRSRRTTLVLEVDAENEPARRLYAKLGWRGGLRVRWWELPVGPADAPAREGRTARRGDRRSAHLAAARQLGFEFPARYLHPCELVCRGMGGRPTALACGSLGAPSLVVRAWAGRPGEPGYLLPVAVANETSADERACLQRGQAVLARAGGRAIFVPVLGESSRLDELLRQLGGSLRATTEFRSKPLLRRGRVRPSLPTAAREPDYPNA